MPDNMCHTHTVSDCRECVVKWLDSYDGTRWTKQTFNPLCFLMSVKDDDDDSPDNWPVVLWSGVNA